MTEFPKEITKIKAVTLPPVFSGFNGQQATTSGILGASGQTMRCDFAQGSLYLTTQQMEAL